MAAKLSFIIVCLLSYTVAAQPTETISYIQNINVAYEAGVWVCGGIACPVETYGCRIQRKSSDEDRKKLNVVSSCFDEQKENILSAATTFEMSKARRIDIDIESYIGAESVYSCGYGLGGNENAHGVISPNDWAELKISAERNMNAVEDSNAAFE